MHTCTGETPPRDAEMNSKLFIAHGSHARLICRTSPFGRLHILVLVRISRLRRVSRRISFPKLKLSLRNAYQVFLAPSTWWGCFHESIVIYKPKTVFSHADSFGSICPDFGPSPRFLSLILISTKEILKFLWSLLKVCYSDYNYYY